MTSHEENEKKKKQPPPQPPELRTNGGSSSGGGSSSISKQLQWQQQQRSNYGSTLVEQDQLNHSDRLDELLSQQQHHQRLPPSSSSSSSTTRILPHTRSRSAVPHFLLGRPPSYRKMKKQSTPYQHHRRHTSLSDFLQDVQQDTRNQLRELSDTLLEEMHDFDSGHSPYFLDMTLMRNMSVLPEDLTEFVNETVDMKKMPASGGEDDNIETNDEAERLLLESAYSTDHSEAVWVGYVLLLVAVLAVSSNGTALRLLHGVPAPLKLYWRMTTTASILCVFALKSVFWNKAQPDLTPAQWLTFACAVVAFTAHTLLLYMALETTTIGNAIIYGNSQALLIIVGKAIVGDAVTALEGLGVATAFAGAMLCSLDSEKSADIDPNHTEAEAHRGDMMALASAVFGVAYLTFAKAVRPHISVTAFMFLVMLLGSWLVLLWMLLARVDITLDRDPHTGLWGWMTTEDNHVFIMLHIAIVCNVLGTMGFVRAMQYFDTIIIAVATLLEPMIASFIAFSFHVGLMPGLLGYFGNALVTLGTLVVVAASTGKDDDVGH